MFSEIAGEADRREFRRWGRPGLSRM